MRNGYNNIKDSNNLKATSLSDLAFPESFNFTEVESIMWRKYQEQRHSKSNLIISSRLYWTSLFVFLTGFTVASVRCFVTILTGFLTKWKFNPLDEEIYHHEYSTAFFLLLLRSLLLSLIVGILCYYQPLAAGSGIPEIKAYLNGINLTRYMTFPILLCKILGMCFSVAAGLPVGKLGPMIHIGGIIGGEISQGNRGLGALFGPNWISKWKLYKLYKCIPNFPIRLPHTLDLFESTDKRPLNWETYQDFRNDRVKRDFMGIGTAAGIAAAFKAPLGGVLFMLEEGTSFWSSQLIFRAGACVLVTIITVNLFFHADLRTSAGLFALGDFNKVTDDNKPSFYLHEVPIFLFMGFLGGCVGGLYNYIVYIMSCLRKKYVGDSKMVRLVELLMLTASMVVLSFVLPYAGSSSHTMKHVICGLLPRSTNMSIQELQLSSHLLRFQCPPGHFNQLASLYLTPPDIAIQLLFHMSQPMLFNMYSLLLFYVPYFIMASLVPGVMAPAGFFVPTLLSGAGFGRMVGCWLHSYDSTLSFTAFSSEGTYALVGSACFLAGVSRITISGVVIMLELTGNMSYLVPLLMAFAGSRIFRGERLFLSQLKSKNIPYLPEACFQSKTNGTIDNYKPVSEIMTDTVVTVYENESVSTLSEILIQTTHNGFPVVSSEGRLRGFILRKTISGLLQHLVNRSSRRAQHKYYHSIDPSNSNNNDNNNINSDRSNSSVYDRGHMNHTGESNDEENNIDNHNNNINTNAIQLLTTTSNDDDDDDDDDDSLVNFQFFESFGLSQSSSASSSCVSYKGYFPSQKAPETEHNLNQTEDKYSLSPKRRSRKQAVDSTYALNKSLVSTRTILTENAVKKYIELEKYYPVYPEIATDTLEELVAESPTQMLDLRYYMDTSPMTINMNTSIIRCYTYFRTLGLRHIVVVDGELKVLGIVTRHELVDT